MAPSVSERARREEEDNPPSWVEWLKERLIVIESEVKRINGELRQVALWKARQEAKARIWRYVWDATLILATLAVGILGHTFGAW